MAHNRIPAKQSRWTRDDWEERLLKAEIHPLRQLALQNDLAMIGHFDHQIFEVEKELYRQTKQVAAREYALLQSVPGIGENLGLTLLYEIGDINRFPTVKDFLSYCRLVKGTVASAGKIKGLRGAKLGTPTCVGLLAKPLSLPNAITSASGLWRSDWKRAWRATNSRPTRCWPSSWPAPSILCSRIKRCSTPIGWSPRWPGTDWAPAAANPHGLTGCAQTLGPDQSQSKISGAPAPRSALGQASNPAL